MTRISAWTDIWKTGWTDRFGSVKLSDERPLSGIGNQWQLSGDESEERTVARC